jgi:hypothetical protein
VNLPVAYRVVSLFFGLSYKPIDGIKNFALRQIFFLLFNFVGVASFLFIFILTTWSEREQFSFLILRNEFQWQVWKTI